jgi:hypothetical protein
MTSSPFDPEALVDPMSSLLGLALTAQSRAETILHLKIAAGQAELLLSGPIDDEEEPAPVFVA